MEKTELAKQLNKKYQEINTPIDWKTGVKTIIEWENLPATDRVVWEKMAEVVEELLKENKEEFGCFMISQIVWGYDEYLKKEQKIMTDKEQYIKMIDWVSNNDSGVSGIAIMRHMLGLPANSWGVRPPFDSDDRGRCIRLLNLFPKWWARLDELGDLNDEWQKQVYLIRKEKNEHTKKTKN